MSDTLLAIMSYGGAKKQVGWSWPHYRTSGYEILGVCPRDDAHDWPAGIEHVHNIGKTGYSTPDLVRRWWSVFDLFCNAPDFQRYKWLMVIEYDGIFLKPPPPLPDGVFTHLAGYAIPGFKAQKFYHSPWAASRDSAHVIFNKGRLLIDQGEFERGSPDFFMGLILQECPKLALHETDTFSVNGGNLTDRKAHAVESIRKGAWYVHGLRSEEELAWVLDAAK